MSQSTLTRHAPLVAAEVLFVISAVSALAEGDLAASVIPAALLVAAVPPPVVERMSGARIPARLQLLYAVLLLGGPYAGSHLGFYGVWTPWDTVVHFYSGVVVALGVVFTMVMAQGRHDLSIPPRLTSLVIAAVGGFVALLWEFGEFTTDVVIGTSSQISNNDTMTDLVAGTASAAIVAGALVPVLRRGGFDALESLLAAYHLGPEPSDSGGQEPQVGSSGPFSPGSGDAGRDRTGGQ